jgi:mycothiol synthase
MGTVQVHDLERLPPGQLSAVLGLINSATASDKVKPLSEQALLDASDGQPRASPGSLPRSTHLLAYAATHLVGYAHHEPGVAGQAATAEVVVEPSYRRRKVGTALISALEAMTSPEADTLQIWSHGDLDGARALALRAGYYKVRELWQMHRPLHPNSASLPNVTVPEGFRSRHFVVGRDEEAWLRVNARAFANHPEQGQITRIDLDRRIAEPWFDASGFILIEDIRAAPVLAASHWTKVAVPENAGTRPTQGEVYVVGVDPAYQGMGLGPVVTVLGLAHLRQLGLTEAMLYVDADNHAGVATYGRLDFTRSAVDIMYARSVKRAGGKLTGVRMGT